MHHMITNSETAGVNVVDFDEPDNLVTLLNDLILANRAMVNVYYTAIERIENNGNIELLQRFAAKHETWLRELNNLIVQYHGMPTTKTEPGNLLKRAWVSLKATLTDGDGPILTEIAHDSKTLLAAYAEVMGNPSLPEDIREVIRTQMSEVRIICKKLSALSAAFA